jgi:hypothetical protein
MAMDGSKATDIKTVHNMYNHTLAPPTNDVVQDYPAALDWRIIVCFLLVGLAILYCM